MAKILVFNGSPHKKGSTATLIEEVANGARSKGAEVVYYNLNDKGIIGCQSCMACRRDGVDACVQSDYLKPMYEELKSCDGFVLGSPIYMGTWTAQSWTLINRLYPAFDAQFKPRYPGKKVATVVTQGQGDANAYRAQIDMVRGFMGRCGWEVVGDIVCGGTNAPDFAISDEMKQAAFDAGAALVD